MKSYISAVIVSFVMVMTVSAQNSILIGKHNATVNIGESVQFSVGIIVQQGFDASVFLSSSSPSFKGMATMAITPDIVNYPYTAQSTFTLNTFKYSKRGVYTVYINAGIGANIVKDSCIVTVVNATPWRIFTPYFGETRPSFIDVDKKGIIYSSLLLVGADEIHGQDVKITNINNPNFDVPSTTITTKGEVWQTLIDETRGTVYYLTNNGLQFYKDNYITIYNKSNSALPDNIITRGCIDSDNKLYLGTCHGLVLFDNYTITRYDKTNSELGDEVITALAVGADNRLWIGTSNGLVVKDGNTWTRYTTKNSGLPAPYIFGLAIKGNSGVWMGVGSLSEKFDTSSILYRPEYKTFNDSPDIMDGLVKFDGTTWTHYNSANSPLLSNYVNRLSFDLKGNLWVATSSNLFKYGGIVSGCGLLKYDGTTWTTFTTSNSLLPDNDVQWVGADRYGNIWFVCKEMFGAMNEEGIPFLVNDVSEQPAESDGIHLFPNPTSTQFTLLGVEGVASVRVVNSLGEEVKQFTHVSSQYSIDVSDLVSGLYFVSIRTAKGAVVKPMMVSR